MPSSSRHSHRNEMLASDCPRIIRASSRSDQYCRRCTLTTRRRYPQQQPRKLSKSPTPVSLTASFTSPHSPFVCRGRVQSATLVVIPKASTHGDPGTARRHLSLALPTNAESESQYRAPPPCSERRGSGSGQVSFVPTEAAIRNSIIRSPPPFIQRPQIPRPFATSIPARPPLIAVAPL